MSLLGLRVSVLYSEGGLRLVWERAVARAVVGLVEMMGGADIQEISIEAPITPQ